VHESKATVRSNFAGKDVSEGREGIIKSLVVDRGIEVLDEDITNTLLAEGRIALREHNSHGLALELSIVEGFNGSTGILGIVEVDVTVAQRSTSDGVTAHSDGGYGSDALENFIELSFRDVRGKVTDVERS